MFTFEERFNDGISGTDAMTNGETASDLMKVVKEEVLMVGRFPRFRLHHAYRLILQYHERTIPKKKNEINENKSQTPFLNKIF